MIKKPKGTHDILPDEIDTWRALEEKFFGVCERFGYKEIRLPVFEHTELFQRGVGDTTDIVQKEMYTFKDKGDRSLTLRPEGTAGVARSFIENGMSELQKPVKLCYNITAYRYENVQKGRYREFHQLGLEAFGAEGPEIDVEIISLLNLYLNSLGLENISLSINSIGCPKCRKEYNEILKEFLGNKLDGFCGLCRDRFSKNPLRILDCKNEKCQEITREAPLLVDYLCDECRDHFEGLQKGLNNLGLDYKINKRIVRGLDYYTKTVFEFEAGAIGAQSAICGGGRYDGLIEECGGKPTCGIGFAIGLERLILLLGSEGIKLGCKDIPSIYVASTDGTREYVQKLTFELRRLGITAWCDLMNKSLKAQMKYADKINAKYCVVIGEDEVTTNSCVIKDMKNGEKREVAIDELSKILTN
ncbi:MAG: histidine--tRNA ligase [Clostridiales bacterium]|nr:histidine--tRNA ligase [Clostridiales bacterium]